MMVRSGPLVAFTNTRIAPWRAGASEKTARARYWSSASFGPVSWQGGVQDLPLGSS